MTACSPVKMRLLEFERTYCHDILDKVHKLKENGFHDNSYDDILQDEETGQSYRVIYTRTAGPIKVDDIFELDIEDFKDKYPDEEFLEARAVYLKPYTIASGKAALKELSNAMQQETERMQKLYKIQKELKDDGDSKPDYEGSAMARQLYSGGW